jgi:hypothetical protein
MPAYWVTNTSVRASDAERERTVASLRRHYAAGRLSLEELEERVVRAYESVYRSDLRTVVRDLPFEMPVDRRRVAGGVDRFQRGLLHAHAWCYVVFNLVLISMWAWAGGHEFWPAFTLIPGGALLLWHNKGSKAASRRLARAGGELPPAPRRRRALAA